jgi:Condensation domain
MTDDLTLRRLSPFEHFLALLDQEQPMHFLIAARIEGHVGVDKWQPALKAVQQRHPLLGSVIATDKVGATFFRRLPYPDVPLRVVNEDSDVQLERDAAAELATPFVNPDNPLMRAVLLRGVNRNTIILTVHHAIADGLSLAYVVRDLMQVLSGERLPALPVPASHERALGVLGVESEQVQFYKQTNGDSRRSTGVVDPIFFQVAPQVKLRTLNEQLAERLRAKARAESSSVNAAVTAAIIEVTGGHTPSDRNKPLRLAFPVSTRAMLQMGECCALLTDGGLINLDEMPGLPFWEKARAIKAQLTEMQSLSRILPRRIELSAATSRLRNPREARELALKLLDAEVVQSSLGIVPIETKHGNLRLESMWGPAMPIGPGDKHFLGIATVDNRFSFLYSSRQPVPSLLEDIESALDRNV